MRLPAGLTAPRLLAVLLIPAFAAGCSPTATYGTGEAPEVALFREVAGGFLSAKKEPIEYQPRAPLVMPPKTEQLPPPADTGATVSPEWPLDPDQRVASAQPGRSNDARYGGSQAEYRRLKPLIGVLPEAPREDLDSHYAITHGKQQREQFRKALAEANGYGRTERRYLTDPPNEYKEPAASAPAEFEDINGSGGDGKGSGWLRWLMRR